MARTERIYRRTEAGQSAHQDPALPVHHRAILEFVDADTHVDLIRAGFARFYSEQQVLGFLDELQTLGFLESETTTADHDLDFTGEFSAAALRAYRKAA